MNKEELEVLRHSASHAMAQAVKVIWPEAKLAIGPAIENGFYYDIDLDEKISPEDFARIEGKMREIVKADYPIERSEMPAKDAVAFFCKGGVPY
jgi:threonyl-tRNA synthetase